LKYIPSETNDSFFLNLSSEMIRVEKSIRRYNEMIEPKFEKTEIAGCVACQALVASILTWATWPCGATVVGVVV